MIPISEIGVVIQGPIQSVGRILTDLSHRTFDATQDVKKMICEAIEVGAHPIVSTWSGQSLELFSKDESDFISECVFPRAPVSRFLRNDWGTNSKYRQYYSTLVGVQELKKKKCKYVLKVRTDNYVDIKKLLHFISGLDESDAEKYVYTPLINLDKPHMFYDFYTFSSIIRLEEFCNVMLYEKEITTNIHFDVFYRWTKHVMNSKFSLQDVFLIYPNYPYFNPAQLELIRLGLSDAFRPLPKEVWTDLFWRGEQLGERGLKPQYRFADSTIDQIIEEFDSFGYKFRDGLNVKASSIPSFFLNSRIEVNLNTIVGKLKSGLRRLTQQF